MQIPHPRNHFFCFLLHVGNREHQAKCPSPASPSLLIHRSARAPTSFLEKQDFPRVPLCPCTTPGVLPPPHPADPFPLCMPPPILQAGLLPELLALLRPAQMPFPPGRSSIGRQLVPGPRPLRTQCLKAPPTDLPRSRRHRNFISHALAVLGAFHTIRHPPLEVMLSFGSSIPLPLSGYSLSVPPAPQALVPRISHMVPHWLLGREFLRVTPLPQALPLVEHELCCSTEPVFWAAGAVPMCFLNIIFQCLGTSKVTGLQLNSLSRDPA